MSEIYYWEKQAAKIEEEEEDVLIEDVNLSDRFDLREVIRNLENRIIEERIPFGDLNPNNSLVKRLPKKMFDEYPKKRSDFAEILLDTFRGSLRTSSRRKNFIVILLQLNDVMVIAHCKKDKSLAQIGDLRTVVKNLLNPTIVRRAGIINKIGDGNLSFAAFAYNRQIAHGFADFWGIEPDLIGWDSLGSIELVIQFDNFELPFMLPVEMEKFNELVENDKITPSGKVNIGNIKGRVRQTKAFQKEYSFRDFFNNIVNSREQLDEYRKKFFEIIPKENIRNSQKNLDDFFNKKYDYVEDESGVYKINVRGRDLEIKKEHPRFDVCFFTKVFPRIKPDDKFLWKIYNSIFESTPLKIWHAGEDSNEEPIILGSLSIFNLIEIQDEHNELMNNLLSQIRDAKGNKISNILKLVFLKLSYKVFQSNHLKFIFEFLEKEIIMKEITSDFKNLGVLDDESDLIDFKLANVLNSKPTKAASNICDLIKKYHKNQRKIASIIYGISDNKRIQPIYWLKSDIITTIEELVKKELEENNLLYDVNCFGIPHNDGRILCILIIPKIN